MQKSLIIFLLCALTGCLKTQSDLKLDFEVKSRTLKNGLKVLLIEDRSVPIVSYQTWVRAGSADEPSGQSGMAHLLEHLMFKEQADQPIGLIRKLESYGAEVNAYTTRDYTVYFENFTSSILDQVIELEVKRFQKPPFNADHLLNEIHIVLEERRIRVDSVPSEKAEEALWALAYPGEVYQTPVIGIPSEIYRTSYEKLMEFYNKYYVPSNMTLVLVGDFDTDEAFEKIKTHYEKMTSAPTPKKKKTELEKLGLERKIKLYEKINSPLLKQAFKITEAGHPDVYALDVLSNILFQGESAKANQKLVEKEDIAIAASGLSFTPVHPGLFSFTALMRNQLDPQEAEKSYQELINEIQTKGVTKKEIDKAVRQLIMDIVDQVRTPYGLGQLVGLVDAVLGDYHMLFDEIDSYLEVTPEDVKRVAKKYLIPNNRITVYLYPEEMKGKK